MDSGSDNSSLGIHDDLLREAYNKVVFGTSTFTRNMPTPRGKCLTIDEWEKRVKMIKQINQRIPVTNPRDKKYYALAKQFRVTDCVSGDATMSEINVPHRLVVHQAMVYPIIRDAHSATLLRGLTSERAIYDCFKDLYKNIPRSMIHPYQILHEKSAIELRTLAFAKMLPPTNEQTNRSTPGKVPTDNVVTQSDLLPGKADKVVSSQTMSARGDEVVSSETMSAWADEVVASKTMITTPKPTNEDLSGRSRAIVSGADGAPVLDSGRIIQRHSILGGRIKVSHLRSTLVYLERSHSVGLG